MSSSRTSQWRRVNKQLLLSCCIDEDAQNSSDLQTQLQNQDQDIETVYHHPSPERIAEITESLHSDFDLFPSDNSDNFLNESNSSCHSSEEEENVFEAKSLLCDLASWSMSHNISHNSLNDLMKVLQKHVDSNLPTDARTVLNTPNTRSF